MALAGLVLAATLANYWKTDSTMQTLRRGASDRPLSGQAVIHVVEDANGKPIEVRTERYLDEPSSEWKARHKDGLAMARGAE